MFPQGRAEQSMSECTSRTAAWSPGAATPLLTAAAVWAAELLCCRAGRRLGRVELSCGTGIRRGRQTAKGQDAEV